MPVPPTHGHAAQAEPWPLRTYLVLGAYDSAVPCARWHVRLVLWEWAVAPELAQPAELLASELVTNGIQATAGLRGSRYRGRWRAGRPPVRLWLWSDRKRVLVLVWDGNGQLPARREPAPSEEHGRGLLLVETLSRRYGVYCLEGATGKVVWALLGAQQPGAL